MFSELMPVLQNTTVTLTISRIDDQLLRVNLIPKRKTERESETEKALATPLTVTATAAELDQDFARQVLSFSSSYQRSAANIREIEEAHAAAVKAAEEERKNGKAKKGTPQLAKTPSRPAEDQKAEPGEKPLFGSKGQSPAPAATQSLFDVAAEEAGSAVAIEPNNGVVEPVNEAERRTATDTAGPAQPAQPSPRVTAAVVQSPDVADATSPSTASETDLCGICKCPILPSQQRHSLMPFPAHASASDCEAARQAAK